jgi:hypothetical protein
MLLLLIRMYAVVSRWEVWRAASPPNNILFAGDR